ncbi:MAG: rod shape-determining protein [Rhodobacteraceae bacterium]|nr:rod shape-determining protein [Paracoccaceae bacterium]
MLDYLNSLFAHDMAIDLGTANTLVQVKGEGIVLDEPSVVAYEIKDGQRRVMAIGEAAKLMHGRTPGSIVVTRPMRDGVIADFSIAEEMVKYFIRKVHKRTAFAKPRIIVCVPHGATPVERRAIRQSVLAAGARTAGLIYEPIAAALGAGIEISQPKGSMIVDIGGGTTEVAVMSLGDIVHAKSIRVGGDYMDEAIINYVLDKMNTHIGHATAEKIKHTIGTARPPKDQQGKRIKFHGRSNEGGQPTEVVMTEGMAADALNEPIDLIRKAVAMTLRLTPPDLASDIWECGIILTGGGALLKDIDMALREQVNLAVTVADDPLTCVAKGTGLALTLEKTLRSLIDYRS